jgi:hypothetical protein
MGFFSGVGGRPRGLQHAALAASVVLQRKRGRRSSYCIPRGMDGPRRNWCIWTALQYGVMSLLNCSASWTDRQKRLTAHLNSGSDMHMAVGVEAYLLALVAEVECLQAGST